MSKSFRIARTDRQPIEFSIDLELPGSQETKSEVFHAVPEVAGSIILDLVASGSLEASFQAAALQQFFHHAVVENDRERFFKTLEQSDPPIKIESLTEIANWLVELYGDRPTSSASPS